MLKNRYFVFINRWVLTLRFCKTDPCKVPALSEIRPKGVRQVF